MNRITLLATTALLAAAGAGVAAAKTGDVVAYGDLGYSYFNTDYGNSYDVDTDVYQAQGAVMKPFTSSWNGQIDFTVLSQQFQETGGGNNIWSMDAFRIGATAFWREQGQGLIGGELAFNSLDNYKAAPGYRVGVRGELFFDGNATFGGALGYQHYEPQYSDTNAGWYGNLSARYYVQPSIAFTLKGEYFTYDNWGMNQDYDQWDVTVEGEYLLPDCDMSIYGGFTYGQPDYQYASNDYEEYGLNIGVRFYLNQDGSLVSRQRTGALAPTTTGLRPYW